MNTEQAQVTVIPDRPRDSQTSDSDSDGPILYLDEEDEEEDEYTNSTYPIGAAELLFCGAEGKKKKTLLNVLTRL